MAPEVIMSLQYDAKAGELEPKTPFGIHATPQILTSNFFLFLCRSLVARNDRVSVLDGQSAVPSSHTTRTEELLREERESCTKVSFWWNYLISPGIFILHEILIFRQKFQDFFFSKILRNFHFFAKNSKKISLFFEDFFYFCQNFWFYSSKFPKLFLLFLEFPLAQHPNSKTSSSACCGAMQKSECPLTSSSITRSISEIRQHNSNKLQVKEKENFRVRGNS